MKVNQYKSFEEIPNDGNLLLENVFFNKSNSSKTVFISEFNYIPNLSPTKELGFLNYFSKGIENVKNYSKEMISGTLETIFGIKSKIQSSLNTRINEFLGKNANTIEYIFRKWFDNETILTEELCFLASQCSKHSKDDRRFSDLRLFDLFTKLPILTISLPFFVDNPMPIKENILIDNTSYNIKSIVESWQMYKNDINIMQVSNDYSFWCYLYKKTGKDVDVELTKTIPITRNYPFEGFIDDKIKIETFNPFIFKGNESMSNRLSLGYKRYKN